MGTYEDKMTSRSSSQMNQVIDDETADSRWKSLYKVGGAAALILGVLFLIAIISLIITSLQPGTKNGWFMLFQNNWLVVFFKLNAGFSMVQADLLHVLNLMDIAIMALVATMFLGLYAALKRTSKIWFTIASSLPFLGIVLFIATQTAGRSGVMVAALIISVVMLRSNIFSKVTAYVGILANTLLLVGDISTAISYSNTMAILIGIGYMLLMTWFFLIGRRIFQMGQQG